MMNRLEENQNGCREQIRNEESASDILENLESYVCDELCCYRGEKLTQEEMDWCCAHCKLQRYVDKIEERLNRQIAQRAFEREHGSREQFMKIFGENCLEEEDEKKDVPV